LLWFASCSLRRGLGGKPRIRLTLGIICGNRPRQQRDHSRFAPRISSGDAPCIFRNIPHRQSATQAATESYPFSADSDSCSPFWFRAMIFFSKTRFPLSGQCRLKRSDLQISFGDCNPIVPIGPHLVQPLRLTPSRPRLKVSAHRPEHGHPLPPPTPLSYDLQSGIVSRAEQCPFRQMHTRKARRTHAGRGTTVDATGHTYRFVSEKPGRAGYVFAPWVQYLGSGRSQHRIPPPPVRRATGSRVNPAHGLSNGLCRNSASSAARSLMALHADTPRCDRYLGGDPRDKPPRRR